MSFIEWWINRCVGLVYSEPRPKVGGVQCYMSDRKIIRLKTPVKSRTEEKLSESTQLSGWEHNQESTILLVKNVACSQELQVTLINEINKLYKQISRLKHQLEEEALVKDRNANEVKLIRGKMEVLEREYKMHKEMYDVQRENHERLRRFYEQREKQWMTIVSEHKRILEECSPSISEVRPSSQFSRLQSMYTALESMLSHSAPSQQPQQPAEPHFGTRRKLRSSIEREDSLSEPKLRLKLSSQKDLARRPERTPVKERPQERIKSQEGTKLVQRQQLLGSKNAQVDELFDSIVRKTYYRYKEKAIAVSEIEQLEDMVKLKNAKTSTHERLAKTIRKLDFQVASEQELKVLCDCVQRAVLEKYKSLRGDYAFDLLIEKLKECQRLALSSNSELERLDREKSNLSQARPRCLYVDSAIEGDSLAKQKTIELLLDSSIKDGREEDLSEHIQFSGSLRRPSSQLQELGVQSKYQHQKSNESSLLL